MRVVGLVTLLLATGCTQVGTISDFKRLEGCGPVTYADVRGHRPPYGAVQLAPFANDHAMCAGRWVPGANEWLVPQGMTIAAGTAYVAGFDGTQMGRHRLCTMQSIDLRTGELIRSRYPVRGQVGPRQPTECRHGGGVVADEHGVWLAETQRLWLLDADTLEVERGWALAEPVRGSFAVLGKGGELGLGRFRAENPARLWWFDVDAMLASRRTRSTRAMPSTRCGSRRTRRARCGPSSAVSDRGCGSRGRTPRAVCSSDRTAGAGGSCRARRGWR